MEFPRLMRHVSCAVLALSAASCRSSDAASAAQSTAISATPAAPKPDEHRRFGSPVSGGAAISLASVLGKPDAFQEKSVIVEAKVRRNCTRRGCWMEIAEGIGADSPGCRVTFKDYGFFVPLDSAGSTARVEGTVQVRVVPGSEVEHLESEGAKFAHKEADGTAREVRMVATGVELWRGPG